MPKTAFVILVICLCLASLAQAECEIGWIPYKDESCIKAFNDFITYDEAKYFCASQENADSTATLVMVKEAEMQELLVSYTEDKFENFWLGAKYDDTMGQFKWEDGDPLTYSNWAEGYPRNNTDVDSCIQFIPVNAKGTAYLDGKWQDTACQRRNLALCQRDLAWSLKDATREIRRLRKELDTVRSEVDDLKSQVVPVGSIYIEYYNQQSPASLWPTLSWEDVTSSYAGLFFRAYGGGSESWGKSQADCAPRIVQTQYGASSNASGLVNPLNLPANGWSEYGRVGYYFRVSGDTQYYEGLRFNVSGCEVRPKNQAIQIWKRLA